MSACTWNVSKLSMRSVRVIAGPYLLYIAERTFLQLGIIVQSYVSLVNMRYI